MEVLPNSDPCYKCLVICITACLILTLGAFLNPLIEWKTDPPIAPMANAPPQSSTIRHGLKHQTSLNTPVSAYVRLTAHVVYR